MHDKLQNMWKIKENKLELFNLLKKSTDLLNHSGKLGIDYLAKIMQ